MVNLLYIFLIVLALKFLMNFSRYFQCKRFLAEYERYVNEPKWTFVESEPQVVKLFSSAGVKDSTFSHVEEIGYGNLQSSRPSVFNNMSVRREDVVHITLRMFHKSIGVYRSRMLDTINPLYWIETIIYLPKQILNYLGVVPESAIIKIAQIIYWISGFIIAMYKTEVDQIFKDLVSKFVP
jgi:hypothetical protein